MQITKRRDRRGWRALIPRHSTVVAYAALILATGGTAAAATGATFLLGHVNTAKTTSGLTNSGKGVALSLKTSSSKYAPLSVSSKALVKNLNASYLDGRPASAFGGVESASIFMTGEKCPVSGCDSTQFGAVSGVSSSSANQVAFDSLTPDVPVAISDLSVQLSTAPGADKVVVAVSVNDGASSPLGCSITGSSTTCTERSGGGTIPAGSRIEISLLGIAPAGSSVLPESVMVGFVMTPA
jgi:hypothetical protein